MTTLNEYVEWSSTLWVGDNAPTLQSIAVVGLGLSGESQEVFSAAHALQRRPSEMNRLELCLELGDVLYYWARVCSMFRLDAQALWETPRVSDGLVALAPAVQLLVNAGKVAEVFKKFVRDNREPGEELAQALTDLGHGWRACCKYHGLKEADVRTANMQKLKERKEHGSLQGSGDVR